MLLGRSEHSEGRRCGALSRQRPSQIWEARDGFFNGDGPQLNRDGWDTRCMSARSAKEREACELLRKASLTSSKKGAWAQASDRPSEGRAKGALSFGQGGEAAYNQEMRGSGLEKSRRGEARTESTAAWKSWHDGLSDEEVALADRLVAHFEGSGSGAPPEFLADGLSGEERDRLRFLCGSPAHDELIAERKWYLLTLYYMTCRGNAIRHVKAIPASSEARPATVRGGFDLWMEFVPAPVAKKLSGSEKGAARQRAFDELVERAAEAIPELAFSHWELGISKPKRASNKVGYWYMTVYAANMEEAQVFVDRLAARLREVAAGEESLPTPVVNGWCERRLLGRGTVKLKISL